MTAKQDPVAKARIVIVEDGRTWSLLSRKRAEGKSKHDKLEMLGGRLEPDETPLRALIRELGEEETTGTLAAIVSRDQPTHRTEVVDHAPHHLFELRLTVTDCADLRHDEAESLGFERLPTAELEAGAHRERLTWRTRRIFEAFGPTPGQG